MSMFVYQIVPIDTFKGPNQVAQSRLSKTSNLKGPQKIPNQPIHGMKFWFIFLKSQLMIPVTYFPLDRWEWSHHIIPESWNA